MGDFRKLEAWKTARRLAVLVHQTTDVMPWRERTGLGDQMRRSAVSVASNIAEGAGRESDREFARFLRIARGSLQELQTQLLIAADLELLSTETLRPVDELAATTGRLLFGLLRYRTHGADPSPP